MTKYSNQEIKTIITDFDETLWKGVIAENERPKLNIEYYQLLVNLYKRGVVLFGITKNDQRDVDSAFKELGLNKDIFVTIIANWESKTSNISLLFQQLELRAETTLFIDDNPLELNEVKSKIPAIAVLNSRDWRILKDNPFFRKAISIQKSITGRYKKYRHALRLFKAKEKFKGTDKVFLYSRRRSIRIGEPKKRNEFDRVAELFYRTNRLNIFRRPLNSIDEAKKYINSLQETGYTIYAVSVKDGGESLGIQAAFSVIHHGQTMLISNGTISCSMISFGDFEKKILNELIKQFFNQVSIVTALVKETSTNIRIREILKDFNFAVTKQGKGEYLFSLNKHNFREQDVPWISVEKQGRVDFSYYGIPVLKNYFIKNEWKKVRPYSKVAVLGIGQGETLGTELTDKFASHLKATKSEYFPIDVEQYENNIVADAEDLHKLFSNESIDYIICTELLEHVEHYWKVINEMLRVLKIGGRIFLSVPYNYPKHEYPIDKWRLSYQYLRRVFSKYCRIEKVQFDGNKLAPRRIILSLVKTKKFNKPIQPAKGKVDMSTGLTFI